MMRIHQLCSLFLVLQLFSAKAFVTPSRTTSITSSRLFSTEDEPSTNIESFADLGLNPQTLSSVAAQSHWDTPTPVQQLAIPRLLKNENEDEVASVWCEAPTGSGKTAAYSLPLLQNLQNIRSDKGQIYSLILCPTRELAIQIGSVVQNLADNVSTKKERRPNVMVLHGGVRLEPQISQLSDYARFGEQLDVLVATPGRLVDVLTSYSQNGDTSSKDAALERRLLDALDQQGLESSLSLEQLEELQLGELDKGNNDDGRAALINLLGDLKYVVFDEADRLLSKAFESDVNAVLELLPEKVPTWMFSATFPKAIEPRLDQVLARIGSKDPLRLLCSNSDRLSTEEISSSLQKKLERSSTVTSAEELQRVGPASTIDLRAIRLRKEDRTQALKKLLEDHPEWDRVLVFVATRYACEHVTRKLRRVGIRASELHGKLDQDARERRLFDLKRGKTRVLLTTDVASRGLDIVGLPVMVNYDLPRSTADFVHRVGRTGRAGKEGSAITFVTAASESHMELIESRHLLHPIERETLDGFEVNEEKWAVEAEGSRISVPGTTHSERGLAHDKMFGGVKGRRKSKKDKLREAAASKTA